MSLIEPNVQSPLGRLTLIQIVVNAFKSEAGADAVAAFGPGQIVIKLRSGVTEVVEAALADASPKLVPARPPVLKAPTGWPGTKPRERSLSAGSLTQQSMLLPA